MLISSSMTALTALSIQFFYNVAHAGVEYDV